jgi:DNA-binding IclR family transcriptional regulator
VLDRAVLIVDTIARDGGSSLADLVRTTGLPRPTAHRLAVALERHGLLVRDRDGRFALGGRVAGWAVAADRALIERARPVLAALVDETGESAQLYVREGDARVCVAMHERASGLRDTVPLGAVMPLTKGSGGKVLLAWAADRDRFEVSPSVLAAVRKRGWAESIGEREMGVASVSAPIRDHTGTVLAAVSVSGPADRLGARPGQRLAPIVGKAAADLAS